MASDLDPDNSDEQDNHESERTKLHNETDPILKMMIGRVKSLGATTLDISKRNIRTVPSELLELDKLEYLYLEGNDLSCLPEVFFDKLPNLRWLDLRYNNIISLPCTYIGRHRHLRTLLLEGNELHSLPLELGLIPTLSGLNIANNPLEFPPSEVIDKGCPEILQFLREMLLQKSQGKDPQLLSATDLSNLTELSIREGSDGETSDEDDDSKPNKTFDAAIRRHSSNPDNVSQFRRDSDLISRSAALHKPVSYYQIRQQHMERLRKAGAAGGADKSREKFMSRSAQSKPNYQTPPPIENIERNLREEKRLARMKELQEKQDLILQRRMDQEQLKEWRDDAKKRQKIKYMQRLQRGKDFVEPIKNAPFGFAEEHIKMPSNEERIKMEVQAAHEKVRRAMSPATKKRMDDIRVQRDKELEKKLQMHTAEMIERRKFPRQNPRDEMAAAKRELQVAQDLQQQLQARRKQLEYRFQAFTGEMPASVYRAKPRHSNT